VIASEVFAIWDENFKPLHGIVKAWREDGTTAYLMTILRSRHEDFSDFSVVLPRATRGAQVLSGTHETVMKFIRGSLDVKDQGRVMEFEQVKSKRQIRGEPGELFVHD